MGANDNHHYYPVPGEMGSEERYRAAHRVTLVGALVNLLLSVAKLVLGYVGHSQALIADGVHSLSDLATDALVLVASKHGSKEADDSHPYGHARIETAFTVALGAVLVLVALGISIDAAERLFHPDQLMSPGIVALAGALVSVLANEGLYRYTLHVAKKTRSNLLKANAWHHRSDAASSVVVIVGVLGTMAGLPYLDAIAAIGVALMIAKIGWDLAWHSLSELVDTALDAERVTAIEKVIAGVDGVRSMHGLRTRRMGPDALVDVHIIVDPKLSVSEGHHISETVRARVIREIDEVQDVLVHIDPEDDETTPVGTHLPSRHELLEQLQAHWKKIPAASDIERVTLHYLDGKVSVDVFVPLNAAGAIPGELAEALARPGKAIAAVDAIRVYYS